MRERVGAVAAGLGCPAQVASGDEVRRSDNSTGTWTPAVKATRTEMAAKTRIGWNLGYPKTQLAMTPASAGYAVCHSLGVVVHERRGQRAVGVGLGHQLLRLLLEGLDGVGAGRPAQRRLVAARECDQRLG